MHQAEGGVTEQKQESIDLTPLTQYFGETAFHLRFLVEGEIDITTVFFLITDLAVHWAGAEAI